MTLPTHSFYERTSVVNKTTTGLLQIGTIDLMKMAFCNSHVPLLQGQEKGTP